MPSTSLTPSLPSGTLEPFQKKCFWRLWLEMPEGVGGGKKKKKEERNKREASQALSPSLIHGREASKKKRAALRRTTRRVKTYLSISVYWKRRKRGGGGRKGEQKGKGGKKYCPRLYLNSIILTRSPIIANRKRTGADFTAGSTELPSKKGKKKKGEGGRPSGGVASSSIITASPVERSWSCGTVGGRKKGKRGKADLPCCRPLPSKLSLKVPPHAGGIRDNAGGLLRRKKKKKGKRWMCSLLSCFSLQDSS